MGFIINNGVLEKYRQEEGITEITVPDNVTKIEKSIFRGCTALESVTLPDNLTGLHF